MACSKHIPKANGGGRCILTVCEMQLCQQHLFILAYEQMLHEQAERHRICEQEQQQEQAANQPPVVSSDEEEN